MATSSEDSELTLDYIKALLRDVPKQEPGKRRTPQGGIALFITRDLSQAFPVNPYDQVYPGIYLGD